MLPHTGLFLLGKVALQMRIRPHFKIQNFLRNIGNGAFKPALFCLMPLGGGWPMSDSACGFPEAARLLLGGRHQVWLSALKALP